MIIYEKALGPEHLEVATTANNLAGLYQNLKRPADAERLYRRALAIYEKAIGPDHPEVANTLKNLAGFYQEQARFAEAEPLYRRALAIYEKALGPEHAEVAITLNNLAGLYQEQGLYGRRSRSSSGLSLLLRRLWGQSIRTWSRSRETTPCC